MSKDKFPFLHFDIGAWWKDNEVQSLDHYHKGVWFELLLIMFESPERGVLLQQNGQQMSNTKAARRLTLGQQEFESVISVLLESGVARQRSDGAIYNEKMVRDEETRLNKSRAGKASAEARLLQQNSQQKGNSTVNREATPSNTNTDTNISTDIDRINYELNMPGFDTPEIRKLITELAIKFKRDGGGRVLQQQTVDGWQSQYKNKIKEFIEDMENTIGKTKAANLIPVDRSKQQSRAGAPLILTEVPQRNAATERLLALADKIEKEKQWKLNK